MAMGCRTVGVDDPLGDALAVEVSRLLKEKEIFVHYRPRGRTVSEFWLLLPSLIHLNSASTVLRVRFCQIDDELLSHQLPTTLLVDLAIHQSMKNRQCATAFKSGFSKFLRAGRVRASKLPQSLFLGSSASSSFVSNRPLVHNSAEPTRRPQMRYSAQVLRCHGYQLVCKFECPKFKGDKYA
jgi:hypothetical protein